MRRGRGPRRNSETAKKRVKPSWDMRVGKGRGRRRGEAREGTILGEKKNSWRKEEGLEAEVPHYSNQEKEKRRFRYEKGAKKKENAGADRILRSGKGAELNGRERRRKV